MNSYNLNQLLVKWAEAKESPTSGITLPDDPDGIILNTPGLLTGHDLLSNDPNFLSSDAFTKNLNFRRGLYGAGGGLLGLGLGAAGGALYSSLFEKPSVARMLRASLLGATVGGLGGAGLGAFYGGSVPAYSHEVKLKNHLNTLQKHLADSSAKTTQELFNKFNPTYNPFTGRLTLNAK